MDLLVEQGIEELWSDRIKSTPPSFIKNILRTASDPDVISFAGGLPNPISFPKEEVVDSVSRIVKNYGSRCFQYSLTAGLPELRKYIADRYNKKFGLNLNIDNVMITTGSQQALDLLGKVFLNEGDGVIIEKPSYLGAIQAFSQYAPEFYPVDLNEDGMDIDGFEAALRNNIKFVYAIPDFQNPTGLSYSIETRNKMTKILEDKNVVFVEDDPYGNLRFDGRRMPYIGLGRLKNSLVLGTFSKIITPGMRTGFIVSENKELLNKMALSKEASDLHTNVFTQYIIWDYLMNNDIENHISKIRNLYSKQAHAMLDAMAKYFPSNVKYTKPEGGMFMWATLPERLSAMKMFPKALERKVVYVPGDPFYVNKKDVNAMRLNYTNANVETITEGIKRLGCLLKEELLK